MNICLFLNFFSLLLFISVSLYLSLFICKACLENYYFSPSLFLLSLYLLTRYVSWFSADIIIIIIYWLFIYLKILPKKWIFVFFFTTFLSYFYLSIPAVYINLFFWWTRLQNEYLSSSLSLISPFTSASLYLSVIL